MVGIISGIPTTDDVAASATLRNGRPDLLSFFSSSPTFLNIFLVKEESCKFNVQLKNSNHASKAGFTPALIRYLTLQK